jgi:hypothetical protein
LLFSGLIQVLKLKRGFDRSTPDSCSCHNTGGKSGTEGITGTVLKAKLFLQWATVVAGGGGAGEGLLRLCVSKDDINIYAVGAASALVSGLRLIFSKCCFLLFKKSRF